MPDTDCPLRDARRALCAGGDGRGLPPGRTLGDRRRFHGRSPAGSGREQAQGAVAPGTRERPGAEQGRPRGPYRCATDEAAGGTSGGLLESWELLPEAYRPLLDEDILTVVGEIEGAAHLARRREALRRHLESVDRREISRRIEDLEQDLAELEESSPLRAPLESALSGRRGELSSYADILEGISMINAWLEDAECLLSNLRGQLLALDTSHSPGSLEPGLAQLQSRVANFRQSMDEVTRRVKTLPAATAEGLPAR